jgi:hypothetical protein
MSDIDHDRPFRFKRLLEVCNALFGVDEKLQVDTLARPFANFRDTCVIGSFEPDDKILHRITLITGRIADRYDGRVKMENDGFFGGAGAALAVLLDLAGFLDFSGGSSATRIGPGVCPRRQPTSHHKLPRLSANLRSCPRGPGVVEFAIILDCLGNIFHDLRRAYYPL